MKTAALITAAALAFAGAAFAQDGGTGPGNKSMGQASPAAAKDFKDLKDKTKRGLHRMGAKMRHAAHRDTHASSTVAMGAPADTSSARQQRMDAAYANYKARQAK